MTTPPRVCFVVGARPNFMKAAPVHRSLSERDAELGLLLVHTGQHYDDAMSNVFLTELELPMPNIFLGVGSGSHAEQTARALVGVEQVLVEHRPALVVVAGDVNSTLAAALAASKLRVPVAHIESGLRSFDDSMPEEANRRLTDHLSELLFTHSESAVGNLRREGIEETRIHRVGNTMIDSVLRYLPAANTREPWSRFDVLPKEYGLATLHRPALVDDQDLLRRTIGALSGLARDRPIIFPVHPRTESRLAGVGIHREQLLEHGLLLTEPLGYLDFLGLEANASYVVTDSGGVQEETSALGVRCFTLRETTERPITVEQGTNAMLGLDPERISTIPESLQTEVRAAPPLPQWDGRAGERAADVIRAYVTSG